MKTATPFQPPGYPALMPYLIAADADRLAAFLREAFDAAEMLLVRNDQGRIQHAAFRIGDAVIELGEAQDQWKPLQAGLHFYVQDADAAYAKALAAGATSLYEPADMPYGERSGGVQDPAGNHWYLATTLAS